jgi:hypothetical protein
VEGSHGEDDKSISDLVRSPTPSAIAMMQRLKLPFVYPSRAKAAKQVKAAVVSTKPQDVDVPTLPQIIPEENGTGFGDSMEWEIEISKNEMERKDEEIRILKEKILAMEKSGVELERQLERARQDSQALHGQLHSQAQKMMQLGARHRHTVDLLGAYTSDVTSGQKVPEMTDSPSVVEVIALVEALNAETLQVAAFIADSFLFGEHGEIHEEGWEVREARKRANGLLGHRIVELLRSVSLEDDPLLLEIAIQSSIATCCRWVTKAWFINNLLYERFLTEIYGGIQDTGECNQFGEHEM